MKFFGFITGLVFLSMSQLLVAEEKPASIVVQTTAVDFLPTEYILVTVDVYSTDDVTPFEIQEGVLSTAKDILGQFANLDAPPTNIGYSEFTHVSLRSRLEVGPAVPAPSIQKINFEVIDLSQLEPALKIISKFELASVSDIQPMVFNPENYFPALVDEAIESARQVARSLEDELNISIDEISNVEEYAELVAFPKKQINVDGIELKPTNLFFENLKSVEVRAEVKVTFNSSRIAKSQ